MGNFANTYPFLAFGGKIDPISEIRNGGLLTSGSVFWVKDISDSDYRTFADQVGAANIFTSIQAAIDKCRNDKNDYVFVCPKDSGGAWTTPTVSSAINLNKKRVHLISVGYGRTAQGYSNTIVDPGTASATDTSAFKVTAEGCEIAGFRFLGTSGTTGNGTYAQVVQYGTASSGTATATWMHDSVVESTQASGGGAGGTQDLVAWAKGDGCRFDNVRFVTSTGGNAALNLVNSVLKTELHDCVFNTDAAATANAFIKVGTLSGSYLLCNRCQFVNVDGANLHASGVTGSVAANLAAVLMANCTYTNVTQAGTDPGVFKAPAESGTAASVRDLGIAVGTAALTPV